MDEKGHSLLTHSKKGSSWESDIRKTVLAKAKGARSIFIVTPAPAALFAREAQRLAPELREAAYWVADPGEEVLDSLQQSAPDGLGVYLVSLELGAELAGASLPQLMAYATAVAQAGRPVRAAFSGAAFTAYLPQPQAAIGTENVLGYLEGSDKKDEVLVVSAHYDHVGIKHDTIYNGADDDGSGTVALLEMAQAFAQAKAAGHGPRRSILFVAMTGEEKGLLGSQYYAAHPVLPLAATIANLNIDMIGRTDAKHKAKDQYVSIVGSDKLSSELHAINEAANRQYTQLDLDYRYNVPNEPEHFYYRSDHYSFAKRRIPVIFYTTGEHPDYHKATDDIEKIEFDKLQKRAQLVFHTAWELANREKRIVVDSNKP